MTGLVVLQRQTSQLDSEVYARCHALKPGYCDVIYWNDYGFSRTQPDSELGIVPDLSEASTPVYPRLWLDRRVTNLSAVHAAITAKQPRLVIFSDIPTGQRLFLANKLRLQGIEVALRSDKNDLSETARIGASLALERAMVRYGYDVLAPVSPLTTAYYAWPARRRCVLFPYTTNEQKFIVDAAKRAERRSMIRAELGIDSNDHVFLSATKFVARERPADLVFSFIEVSRRNPRAHLVALGDGPLLAELRKTCAEQGVTRVHFPGFIPFRRLQDYFFAADTFLHLAAFGPWEVSPQDALAAGLQLVTSDKVGSGRMFLEGQLARFLVPLGDRTTAIARMVELSESDRFAALFAPARRRVAQYTASACAERLMESIE
jgi:glycosyltransferase involved in cell wall biosynthesis